jgi:nicotinamidase-related amidase
VCVKQTCLDLLEQNYEVTLVIDAISSMSYHDRTVAVEAMRDAGASITTF